MIGQKKLLMDTIKTQLRQNNTKISAESEMTLCHTSRRHFDERFFIIDRRKNPELNSVIFMNKLKILGDFTLIFLSYF